ncbi:MAG: DUF2332 domain-containing protein [Caldilineaceae bacterium]
MQQDPIAAHARRFAWRAEHIYGVADRANASPLYAHVSAQIATDPDVIRLVVNADSHTTTANLLFGAVHFLLLSGVTHPLADFYPSLTTAPRPVEDAYPHFRAFSLEYAETIEQIILTHTVQTNEVQRCTGLLPAFTYLAQKLNHRPFDLIEVGASAGLNLYWDRYAYDYQGSGQVGAGSPVQLTCEVRGEHTPPLLNHFPIVASRVGIELMPIDIDDEEAIRWVRALIWPEHRDRAHLFQQALTVARHNPPPIIAGDMVAQLPNVLSSLAGSRAICLYHSYTLNQCPRAVGEAVEQLLLEHSRRQPLYRIALEWYGGQVYPHLELFAYRHGTVTRELLAYCESHGRWIAWLVGANN